MRNKGIWILCFVMAVFLGFGAFAGQSQAAETPEYTWRLVSEEVEGDFMTDWAHEFADRMAEWSDGNIKIEVYPYGTLGGERDINELCQLGEVEFVMSDYGWISSFVPQAQVLALHYLWPREKSVEVFNEVFINGEVRGLLEEGFRARNFEPLGYLHEGWQWITHNKKIRTPEDTEGVKIRVMGSPMLLKAYGTYGFDAVTLDYGEIYSALQMNLIDAQVQPMFANYSMGFYEQVDYITNMEAEMFIALPLANKEFFDSLPQEIQDKMLEVWADLMVPAGEDSLVREQKFIDLVKEKRPNIEFYRFTDEDIAPFRELSKSLHDEYLKIGGDGAEKILETLLADLEKAKAKYGVN
jgi:TRAP-type C4-dicarboxylate transport system substrate-binding protein